MEASRPASGGWRTAKATKWCQALLFNVSSRHHLLGRYRAISFRATFRALIWRVFSRLDFFSRHISCSHLTSFFPVRFFFSLTDYNFPMKNVPSSHLYDIVSLLLEPLHIPFKSYNFLLSFDEFFSPCYICWLQFHEEIGIVELPE